MPLRTLLAALLAVVTLGAPLRADEPDKLAHRNLHRASELIGLQIKAGDKQTGELVDFVFDPRSKKVAFAVITHELMAEHRFAIPVAKLSVHMTKKGDPESAALALTREELAGAPRFSQDEWDKAVGGGFAKRFAEHFGVDLGREDAFGALRRASKCMNMTVLNKAKDNLGELEDYVIRLSDGELVYGVLAAGGVLELGETMIPVPFGEYTFRTKDVVLDRTAKQLEKAPRLEGNVLKDERWNEKTRAYYREAKAKAEEAMEEAEEKAAEAMEEAEEKAEEAMEEAEEKAAEAKKMAAKTTLADRGMHRASELIGLQIKAGDEQVGEIVDFVFDPRQGKTAFAVISHQLTKEHRVALPIGKLRVVADKDGDPKWATVTLTEKELAGAPRFAQDEWDTAIGGGFAKRVAEHFQIDLGRKDAFGALRRATECMNMTVLNKAKENLGELEDYVIQMSDGELVFGVLAAGGVLELGETMIPLPFREYEFRAKDVVVDRTAEQLEKAQRLEGNVLVDAPQGK